MSEWTKQQLEILRAKYPLLSVKDLALILDKSESSIRNKAYRLQVNNRDRFWTKAELDIVKHTYEHFSHRGDIALDSLSRLLGRPKTVICQKASLMGLTIRNRKLNSKEQKRLSQFAFKLGHKPWSAGKKCPQLAGKNNSFYGKHHTLKTKELLSEIQKQSFANGRVHPRGFLDKTHSVASRKLMGQKSKKAWADPKSGLNSITEKNRRSKAQSERITILMREEKWNPYSNAKSGIRSDLGIYVRSAMEANYLRYLTFLKVDWLYEPEVFRFEKIKRGTLSYTPDIYLPSEDTWIEIKGWFRDKDKTKLKRFKKYFPLEFSKLIFVVSNPWGESKGAIKLMTFLADILKVPDKRIEDFREIKNKLGGLIPNWE